MLFIHWTCGQSCAVTRFPKHFPCGLFLCGILGGDTHPFGFRIYFQLNTITYTMLQSEDPSDESSGIDRPRKSLDLRVTFISPVITNSPPSWESSPECPDSPAQISLLRVSRSSSDKTPAIRRSLTRNSFTRSIDRTASAGFAATSSLHKSFEIRSSLGSINLFAANDIIPTEEPDDPIVLPLPEDRFWVVEADLILPKILYFIYYAAQVCLIPFFNIWYRHIGLSSAQIGTLAAIRQLMNLFGPPVFSAIADRLHIHKIVLITGPLVALLGRLSMLVMREYFYLLCALLAVAELFASLGGPMLDNIVLKILTEERRESFGRQRLWGTVAFASLATPVGYFVDSMSNPNWHFYLNGMFTIIFVTLVFRSPVGGTGDKGEKEADRDATTFSEGMKMLVGRFEGWSFFSTIGLLGMCNGLIGTFLFLYLQDMHASKALLGLCLTTNGLSEIPALFFSGTIIRKISAPGGILLACAAYILRLLWYFALPTPTAVLPAELLNSITFGIMYTCAVRIAADLAPPSMGATAQGTLASVYNGFAALAGILGGLLYQRKGHNMWLLGVGTAASALVWYGFSVWMMRRKVVVEEEKVEKEEVRYTREGTIDSLSSGEPDASRGGSSGGNFLQFVRLKTARLPHNTTRPNMQSRTLSVLLFIACVSAYTLTVQNRVDPCPGRNYPSLKLFYGDGGQDDMWQGEDRWMDSGRVGWLGLGIQENGMYCRSNGNEAGCINPDNAGAQLIINDGDCGNIQWNDPFYCGAHPPNAKGVIDVWMSGNWPDCVATFTRKGDAPGCADSCWFK
ncbi:major facilitator superfamily domain-containing protein 6-like [Planoprotostelium fungivorum]|uniref:Major facilitator superfamily domain-containing protein 6-like n=1 Tax=Planoprotostelium fungivorum TaxID=1890364 RepID=A0A2P6N166_9EUKA|nr:major facilitator superfamily domain-containing protein 6-like [Planoprotostelium fungivorum]